MIRFGLCCKFLHELIQFRTTTATALLKLERKAALEKLSHLCLQNAVTLEKALQYCAEHHIGDFRVNSQILPVKTHPQVGYDIHELPRSTEIINQFKASRAYAEKNNLRITFHPDQFVVLNSPHPDVVLRSIAELEYQAEVATWIGAEVINIHRNNSRNNRVKSLFLTAVSLH